METSELTPLIDQLDDNIDDLQEALAPLLKGALSESVSKLPLLDRAQVYILVTYAIESILFSYLRLNGVNAKEHPVFRELTRVKQYFEKIKAAEGVVDKPTVKLDKAAAGRFIKHALAGSAKQDAKWQEADKVATLVRTQERSKRRKLEGNERGVPEKGSAKAGSNPGPSSCYDVEVPKAKKKKSKHKKGAETEAIEEVESRTGQTKHEAITIDHAHEVTMEEN